MSVVCDQHDDVFGVTKLHCAVCEQKLRYPCLYWSEDLCICGKCCQEIKRGFTADLI